VFLNVQAACFKQTVIHILIMINKLTPNMVSENGLNVVILQFLPATETGKPEDKKR
jgi:hypothetical protein